MFHHLPTPHDPSRAAAGLPLSGELPPLRRPLHPATGAAPGHAQRPLASSRPRPQEEVLPNPQPLQAFPEPPAGSVARRPPWNPRRVQPPPLLARLLPRCRCASSPITGAPPPPLLVLPPSLAPTADVPRPPSADAGDPAVDLATTAPIAPSSTRTPVAARFIHLCPISRCSPPQQLSGHSTLPNPAVQRCSTKTFRTLATGILTGPIPVGAPSRATPVLLRFGWCSFQCPCGSCAVQLRPSRSPTSSYTAGCPSLAWSKGVCDVCGRACYLHLSFRMQAKHSF
nr:proline-rich receptor-like protein kinase PERK8 [Aegilops tauschii subsp. strangulata]